MMVLFLIFGKIFSTNFFIDCINVLVEYKFLFLVYYLLLFFLIGLFRMEWYGILM